LVLAPPGECRRRRGRCAGIRVHNGARSILWAMQSHSSPTAPAPTSDRRRAVWSRPGFSELVGSQFISLIGDRIATLAFVSLAARAAIENPGAAAANVAAVEVAPIILLSYFAGWLSDRFSRRNLMLGIDVLRAAVVAAAATGIVALSTPGSVLLLAGILGILSAQFNPAKRSFIPFLVPYEEIPAANWWMVITEICAMMLGIGLGTILLSVTTPENGLFIDSLTFLAAIVVLLRMPRGLDRRKRHIPAPEIEASPVMSADSTRKVKALFAALILPFFLAAGLFYSAANHWAAAVAPSNAGAPLGRLLLLLSLGALASVALRGPLERIGEPGSTAVVFAVGGVVQLILASQAGGGLLIVGPLTFIVGLGVGLAYVRTQYLLHLVTPLQAMGRVMSIREVIGAAAFAGTVALTGAMGGLFSAAAGWYASGIVFLVGAFLTRWLVKPAPGTMEV